ncbi:hypothetical protein QO259_09700 [Salinicola sp. JS01]|uniref:capsular polysaccharide export protein, LipB/KpsS family n=1 Tax=Salinicola sp. JS01 TaxID=3050071 RepID=UPI00255BFA93|nr:hypothetical protein [Salinicola sp. JS01]WIX34885.1 hypothetical protein QO259_09700 [Salinicola sp. JS01]
MFFPQRTYLFLEGPASPFFDQLAQRLLDDGHRVVKLHLHLGERLYWHHPGALSFRDPLAMLPHVLGELWRQYHVTDQVLFQMNPPAHALAVALARRYGIRNHLFEHGYLGPGRITLEREGSGARSLLPRDPWWFHAAAEGLSEPAAPAVWPAPGLLAPALPTLYRLGARLTPRRGAASVSPMTDQRPPIWPMTPSPVGQRTRAAELDQGPFFILSTGGQLGHDGQAPQRCHLERVIAGFARVASARCRLLLLPTAADHHRRPPRRWAARLARRLALGERLGFLDPMQLPRLLPHASGWVGQGEPEAHLALAEGCPLFALSDAHYCLPGLAASDDLELFWRYPRAPETDLYQAFRRVLIHVTQIEGDFHASAGRDRAVIEAAERLTANISPIEQLLHASHARVAS